jgi:GNAT superfamily N-acetyltransferase
LEVAVWRGLDLTGIWVIVDAHDQLVWAVLPMALAGKAMLMMVPPRLRPSLNSTHVSELIASSLMRPEHAGVTLVQVLLDPAHRAVNRALLDAGFEDIAELLYLRRQVRQPIAGRVLGERYRLWRYDGNTHYRFAQCIGRTYEASLDCPRLSGRRDIEDIIVGHKSAGEFDPELWMLLSDLENNDLGVMLLNRLQGREGYELVYIGLTPEARGKGLADQLIRTAINTLANEGGGQIITACDAHNVPARRLYHRHGFAHLYARCAMVKDLRKPRPAITPALLTS